MRRTLLKSQLGFLLIATAIAGWFAHQPAHASAQDMSFGVDEAQGSQGSQGESSTKSRSSRRRRSKTKQPSTTIETGAATQGSTDSATTTETAIPSDAGSDVIGELAAPEPATQAATVGAADTAGAANEAVKEADEEIYAVQQVYALRNHRLELAPSIAFTMNDPFVSHPAPALAINYWWTNVLAIGVNALWYQGLENESDTTFQVRRFSRLGIPISEYQMSANLNFTYVPLYGKFSMFNEFIFQWDGYVVGGVGLMRTRPVPVFDPEVRQFDFANNIAFNVGLGLRVFVTRWLAIYGELRNYMFLEKQENTEVALNDDRYNPDTWLSNSPTLVNNITSQIGVNIFIPFDFEYKRPK